MTARSQTSQTAPTVVSVVHSILPYPLIFRGLTNILHCLTEVTRACLRYGNKKQFDPGTICGRADRDKATDFSSDCAVFSFSPDHHCDLRRHFSALRVFDLRAKDRE